MTPRFLIATSGVAALLLAPPVARARLGETLAQCTERYGPVRATLPAVVAESDPDAARFEYGALGVIVHFQKGVAWHISYAQGYMSDPDKNRLLKENVETGEWKPRLGLLAGNVFLWRHREAGLVACAVNAKALNTLEVMTQACADAFGRARAKRIQDAATSDTLRSAPAVDAAAPGDAAEKRNE